MHLKPEQIDAFYKIGYFTQEDVFSKEEVKEISMAIGRLQKIAESLEGKVMHNGSQFVVTDHQIRRVVWCGAAEPILLQYGQDKRLKSIASEILGSRQMNQLINQIHFKLPNDGVIYPFHQDSRHRQYGTEFWNDVNGKGSYVQIVTAIDKVTEDNGPMLFIPGSCKYGHLGLPYDENQQTVSSYVDIKKAVPVLMKPGSIAAFGPYTIHGSLPNTSEKPRRAFINGFAYPGANKAVYPGKGSGALISLE